MAIEIVAWGIAAVLLIAVLAQLRRVLRRPVRWIVVDGSNVMFWDGNTAKADTLAKVAAHLETQGFRPVIWFDANAGYKLAGRYEGAARLARRIGVARNRVLVAAKGQPADPLVLDGARQLGARVVSNDRFRDWRDEFPEIAAPGHLVGGGLRDGTPWLDL